MPQVQKICTHRDTLSGKASEISQLLSLLPSLIEGSGGQITLKEKKIKFKIKKIKSKKTYFSGTADGPATPALCWGA